MPANDRLVERLTGAADHLLTTHYRNPLSSQILTPSGTVPCLDDLVAIVRKANLLFHPGYFCSHPISDLRDWSVKLLGEIHDLLEPQIAMACALEGKPVPPGAALGFVQALPRIHAVVLSDLAATLDGDPAARGYAEIILAYPGYAAVTIHRLAHALHALDVPLLPRMMSEYAHGRYGIDVHPGARVGERFFVDHGTGVVVGETAVIGANVKIYQGVTLGALSIPRDAAGRVVRHGKRHPTIEDDVVIYAGATILGGETVIGRGSVIGGNAWITSSVAPGSKITKERNA